MALSNLVIAVILISISFIGLARSEKSELTSFGKKVKKLMSDETYNKTFSVNTDSDDELMKAIEKGTKKFYEILGLKYNKSVEETEEKENEDIGVKNISSEILFDAQTYAIQKAFDDGLLSDKDIDDLAQKYVDKFDESAKSVTEDDIASTFTAQSTAVAKFLKSQGVTSEKDVTKTEKYFLEELKKN